MPNPSFAQFKILVEVSMAVAFPVLLGMAGFTFTSLMDHESRLDVIESTRYTGEEAEAEMKEHTDQISELKTHQAVITAQFEGFEARILDQMDNIQIQLDHMNSKLLILVESEVSIGDE